MNAISSTAAVRLLRLFKAGLLCSLVYAGSQLSFWAVGEVKGAELKHIRLASGTGGTDAVVVGDMPLIHTTQFLPFDDQGRVSGGSEFGGQLRFVWERMLEDVRRGGGDRATLVRLNLVVRDPALIDRARKELSSLMGGAAMPAVSVVVGGLGHPGLLVGIDAVAGSKVQYSNVHRLRTNRAKESSVAILPPGKAVYVSGQAEPGTVLDATLKTMIGLERTLKLLGLDRQSIVQVKAFVTPISQADAVRDTIRGFFGAELSPPIVLVEWISQLPVEIEIIASGRDARGVEWPEPLSFYAPPGITPSPVYSKVALFGGGSRIFTSSLSGESGQDATRQTEAMFEKLELVLKQAGGNTRQLIKATYYVSDALASSRLNELRPRYYDSKRPPAASKAMVPAAGETGVLTSMDMIGLVP